MELSHTVSYNHGYNHVPPDLTSEININIKHYRLRFAVRNIIRD
jgi:hypothetical protein